MDLDEPEQLVEVVFAMITLLGTLFAAAGVVLWLWTIKSYVDNPGHGDFDMNTAPLFAFGWFKGALSLALGVGLVTQTWWIGAATGVAGMLVLMVVQPVLGSVVARRIENATAANRATQPPNGLKALSQVERDLEAEADKTRA